jgi:hypothetical protein
VPLLAALAAPIYAARRAQLAQLVQRRLLVDVTSRDLSLTVRHAQRQVDHGLVARCTAPSSGATLGWWRHWRSRRPLL